LHHNTYRFCLPHFTESLQQSRAMFSCVRFDFSPFLWGRLEHPHLHARKWKIREI
jgi:hypothetical protein